LQKDKLTAPATSRVTRRRRSKVAKRKRRSADDILNRIVQAAGEEFKRNGFAGATTAAIARRADVTQAQLFRYFGSKSNLFRETIFKPIDQHLLSFTDQHMPQLRDPASFAQLTNLYIAELQRFIGEHADMLKSLVLAQTYESANARGVGGIDSLHAYFDRSAAMVAARLKEESKVDPRLMVRVAFVSVLASVMFKDWIFPADLASDAEIRAAINCFIREGIGPRSTPD
jgi:AcrR family transcriptional regulator